MYLPYLHIQNHFLEHSKWHPHSTFFTNIYQYLPTKTALKIKTYCGTKKHPNNHLEQKMKELMQISTQTNQNIEKLQQTTSNTNVDL